MNSTKLGIGEYTCRLLTSNALVLGLEVSGEVFGTRERSVQRRVHGMNQTLRMSRALAVEIPHNVGITTEVTIVTGDTTSSPHSPVVCRFHDDHGILRAGDVEEF